MTWLPLVIAVAVLVVSVAVQVRVMLTLDAIQEAARVVAANLADSKSRADSVDGPHGAAGDAAARTGDVPE